MCLLQDVWNGAQYLGCIAQVCGNDKAHVRPEGPGGIPEGAHLSREGTGLWKPPGALGHKQNDGTLVGQIAGEPLVTFACRVPALGMNGSRLS